MQYMVINAQNNALVFLSCLTKEKRSCCPPKKKALKFSSFDKQKEHIWHFPGTPTKR